MKYQHRATPEQWQAIKANGHLPTRSTILELLHRIESLEATQHAHVGLSHVIKPGRECPATRLHSYKVGKAEPIENWGEGHTLVDPPVYAQVKPNHPEIPDSSLVKRVACAIYPDGSGDGFCEEARDAIREVAAWLQENYGRRLSTIALLEQEAKR